MDIGQNNKGIQDIFVKKIKGYGISDQFLDMPNNFKKKGKKKF